jgi:hypothetical protein
MVSIKSEKDLNYLDETKSKSNYEEMFSSIKIGDALPDINNPRVLSNIQNISEIINNPRQVSGDMQFRSDIFNNMESSSIEEKSLSASLSLEFTLHNFHSLQFFIEYNLVEYSAEYVFFWIEVEIYKTMSTLDKNAILFSNYIYAVYLKEGAPLSIGSFAKNIVFNWPNKSANLTIFNQTQGLIYDAMLDIFNRYEGTKLYTTFQRIKGGINGNVRTRITWGNEYLTLNFLKMREAMNFLDPENDNTTCKENTFVVFQHSVLNDTFRRYFPKVTANIRDYFKVKDDIAALALKQTKLSNQTKDALNENIIPTTTEISIKSHRSKVYSFAAKLFLKTPIPLKVSVSNICKKSPPVDNDTAIVMSPDSIKSPTEEYIDIAASTDLPGNIGSINGEKEYNRYTKASPSKHVGKVSASNVPGLAIKELQSNEVTNNQSPLVDEEDNNRLSTSTIYLPSKSTQDNQAQSTTPKNDLNAYFNL